MIILMCRHVSGKEWLFRVLRTDDFTCGSGTIAVQLNIEWDRVKLFTGGSEGRMRRIYHRQGVSKIFGPEVQSACIVVETSLEGGGGTVKKQGKRGKDGKKQDKKHKKQQDGKW